MIVSSLFIRNYKDSFSFEANTTVNQNFIKELQAIQAINNLFFPFSVVFFVSVVKIQLTAAKRYYQIQATVKRRLTTPITASKTLNIVAYSLENQRQTPFFALKKFLYYNNYRKQNR